MKRAKVKSDNRPGRRRPGVLVQFRLPLDLAAFLDGWSAAEDTSRSALLLRLVAMAQVGAAMAESDDPAPLFKEIEGQVEVMVGRVLRDQQERDRTAAMALGGVVSSRRRAVRK